MSELINEARIEWSSFRDVFDVFEWVKFVDTDIGGMVLLIKTTKENQGAILTHYRHKAQTNQIIRFGSYFAIIDERPFVISLLEDLQSIINCYKVSIKDNDCLFLNVGVDTIIRNADDILTCGRWILLDKKEEYHFNLIEVRDKSEMEYLFSQLIFSNYFGFDNFKRIIDIIESTGRYEYLSLLIGAGLTSCPTAFNYTLSYLSYILKHRNYFDQDLLTMLFRFGFYHHFIDREPLKIMFESAFPGNKIYEVMEGVFYYSRLDYTRFW